MIMGRIGGSGCLACEERPLAVRSSADLPSEHLHLLAERVLELELRYASASGEQTDETSEDKVGKGTLRGC